MKAQRRQVSEIVKLPTGIAGFDVVAQGGLPRGAMTLVSGTAGSAKTVLAAQFLAEGIRKYDQPGVFVTFEERPDRICSCMLSLGWDFAGWEADEKLAFVDASPYVEGPMIQAGAFNLDALLARIEHAVKSVGAKRVVIDSLGTMFAQVNDPDAMRSELFRIALALQGLGVTTILTAEREEDGRDISHYGVEEFVSDNVIILRNSLDEEKRRRTLEILKFRGTRHQKGEVPFAVIDGQGVVLIPLSGMQLKQHSSNARVGSGNDELDVMCGGGFLKDSIILVSGATGTGKTLTTTQYLAAAAAAGERCVLFAYEESRDQIFRNAKSWGFDFESFEKKGLLKVICDYPETTSLDEHLVIIKETIDAFKPARIAVDSLSALERVATDKSYRELVLGITSLVKEREIMGLVTATTASLLGGTSVTEAHISTITDAIILLRYVEILGEMRRGVMVLKMRGSEHNKEIREFAISGRGMRIGKSFKNVIGILSGTPTIVSPAGEAATMRAMFSDLESDGRR